MQFNWLWLTVGLLPYAFQWQRTRDGRLIRVRALFWRVSIRLHKGECSWDITFPFIEHWPQGQ